MKIYLVGGAIRDSLLGLPVAEKDWVVVGGTPEAMMAQGYQPVGKDFPVFLHPTTHEEYALARTERKVGKGYKGFTFYAEPDVRLEEDLMRRDLTINAIAQENAEGVLIDPYGGQEDLQRKRLRHVSPAFAEDPVRILRVARFAAKLPGFQVDPTTNALMNDMVNNGEVNALVSERVWQEFSRALSEKQPSRFFDVLNQCSALKRLFPIIELNGEGIQALNRSVTLTTSNIIRFAALMYHTDPKAIQSCVQHYRIPNEYSDLAMLAARQQASYQKIQTLDASKLLLFIRSVDAIRRPDRFKRFLMVMAACIDDTCHESRENWIGNAIEAIQSVDMTPLQEKGFTGQAFADALYELQIQNLNEMISANLKE